MVKSRLVTEVELYPRAVEALRNLYPVKEGWEIRFDLELQYNSQAPRFVVEKKEKNMLRRVVAELVVDHEVSESQIRSLDRHSENFRGRNTRIEELLFIVPHGCDTGKALKKEIKIHHLENFSFNG
jgi:hypothetical protein